MDSHGCRKCTICGVRKLPKSSIFLARFPLDPDRCRLWVKASGIEDLVEKLNQLKFICGAHFARECFNAKGNRLLPCAVPTEGLTRTSLTDDLLTEFPLHVKSYYDKINGKKITGKYNNQSNESESLTKSYNPVLVIGTELAAERTIDLNVPSDHDSTEGEDDEDGE